MFYILVIRNIKQNYLNSRIFYGRFVLSYELSYYGSILKVIFQKVNMSFYLHCCTYASSSYCEFFKSCIIPKSLWYWETPNIFVFHLFQNRLIFIFASKSFSRLLQVHLKITAYFICVIFSSIDKAKICTCNNLVVNLPYTIYINLHMEIFIM